MLRISRSVLALRRELVITVLLKLAFLLVLKWTVLSPRLSEEAAAGGLTERFAPSPAGPASAPQPLDKTPSLESP